MNEEHPITAAFGFGLGGNSKAARSARAKLQRRDRKGQFAFQGGGFSFNIRFPDGVRKLSGRVVGASGTEDIEIEVKGRKGIPDGIYALPSNKGESVAAILPPDALKDLPPVSSRVSERLAIDSSTLKRMDQPTGWAKQVTPEGEPEIWTSEDGYFVKKDGDAFTLHRADLRDNSIGDQVGRGDSWADMQKAAVADQDDYEKVLEAANEARDKAPKPTADDLAREALRQMPDEWLENEIRKKGGKSKERQAELEAEKARRQREEISGLSDGKINDLLENPEGLDKSFVEKLEKEKRFREEFDKYAEERAMGKQPGPGEPETFRLPLNDADDSFEEVYEQIREVAPDAQIVDTGEKDFIGDSIHEISVPSEQVDQLADWYAMDPDEFRNDFKAEAPGEAEEKPSISKVAQSIVDEVTSEVAGSPSAFDNETDVQELIDAKIEDAIRIGDIDESQADALSNEIERLTTPEQQRAAKDPLKKPDFDGMDEQEKRVALEEWREGILEVADAQEDRLRAELGDDEYNKRFGGAVPAIDEESKKFRQDDVDVWESSLEEAARMAERLRGAMREPEAPAVTSEERPQEGDFRITYEGPEVVYTFTNRDGRTASVTTRGKTDGSSTLIYREPQEDGSVIERDIESTGLEIPRFEESNAASQLARWIQQGNDWQDFEYSRPEQEAPVAAESEAEPYPWSKYENEFEAGPGWADEYYGTNPLGDEDQYDGDWAAETLDKIGGEADLSVDDLVGIREVIRARRNEQDRTDPIARSQFEIDRLDDLIAELSAEISKQHRDLAQSIVESVAEDLGNRPSGRDNEIDLDEELMTALEKVVDDPETMGSTQEAYDEVMDMIQEIAYPSLRTVTPGEGGPGEPPTGGPSFTREFDPNNPDRQVTKLEKVNEYTEDDGSTVSVYDFDFVYEEDLREEEGTEPVAARLAVRRKPNGEVEYAFTDSRFGGPAYSDSSSDIDDFMLGDTDAADFVKNTEGIGQGPGEPPTGGPSPASMVFDEMFEAPDGAYRPNVVDVYEPKGRQDDNSIEYTDDPSVLATKFTLSELIFALRESVIPENAEEASGFGSLDFGDGDELVPAEALYEAIDMAGADSRKVLAAIYDEELGPDAGTPNMNRYQTELDDDALLDQADLGPLDKTLLSDEEALELNRRLSQPSNARVILDEMEDYVETDEELLEFADFLKEFDEFDIYVDGSFTTLLDRYLMPGVDASPAQQTVAKALWGMLMSLDGSSSEVNDEESDLRGPLMERFQEKFGNSWEEEYANFLADFGGFNEFVQGKSRIVNGEDDLDSESVYANFVRAMKAASTENTVRLQRSFGVPMSNPILLSQYTTVGNIFSLDPRPFSTNDFANEELFQSWAPDEITSHRVVLVADPGEMQSVSAVGVSWFSGEQEHIGHGEFEVVSVERKPASRLRPGAVDDIIVTVKKAEASSEDLAAERAVRDFQTQQDVPSREIKDVSNWTRTGDQTGGSNVGAYYEDENGQGYYVKVPKSQSHAENETLASVFYDAMGAPSAEVSIGDDNGDVRVVSKLIPGATGDLGSRVRAGDDEYLNKLREHFIVDAWLANYDVTGTGFDNVMSDSNGDPVRVDPGGALMWRAQGAPKSTLGMFTEETDYVPELDTLRDRDINFYSASVFGSLTDDDLRAQAESLRDNMSPERIDAIVDSVITDLESAEFIKERLRNRRQGILDRFGLEDRSALTEPVSIEDSVGYPASELQAGDVMLEDSFTVERVFRDVNTPEGKVSIEGYYPGHLPQRKEFDENFAVEAMRGGSTPPKGDQDPIIKPARPGFNPTGPSFSGSIAEELEAAESWAEIRDILADKEIVFFDYETTGLGPESLNRPVQLGAVKVRNGEVIDRFNVFIDPQEQLSEWSKANLLDADGNPLTDEYLSQQTGMGEAHSMFVDWMGESPIIGAHNMPFDREVLERIAAEENIDLSIGGYIDTLGLGRDILKKRSNDNPDGPQGHRLPQLLEHYGIELENWHTADADSEGTANLFRSMLDDVAGRQDVDPSTREFDRKQREYSEAMQRHQEEVEAYKDALAEYEAKKAVAAAWNCGGGLTAAATENGNSDCNVPSIDEMIENASVKPGELSDPEAITSGDTSEDSNPLDEEAVDSESGTGKVAKEIKYAAPGMAPSEDQIQKDLDDTFEEVFNFIEELIDPETTLLTKASTKTGVKKTKEKLQDLRNRLNSGEITGDEAAEELASIIDDLPGGVGEEAVEVGVLEDLMSDLSRIFDGTFYQRPTGPDLPPIDSPRGYSKDGVFILPGMRVRDKWGYAGTVDRYNKGGGWKNVYVQIDLGKSDNPKKNEQSKGTEHLTVIPEGGDNRPWAYVAGMPLNKLPDNWRELATPGEIADIEAAMEKEANKGKKASTKEIPPGDDGGDSGGGGGGISPSPSDDDGGDSPKAEAPEGATEVPEEPQQDFVTVPAELVGADTVEIIDFANKFSDVEPLTVPEHKALVKELTKSAKEDGVMSRVKNGYTALKRYRFVGSSALNALLRKEPRDYVASIQASHKKTLEERKQSGYVIPDDYVEMLNSKQSTSLEEATATQQVLDDLFDEAPSLGRSMILFRGVTSSFGSELEKYEVGEQFTDFGYGSTSTSKKKAKDFIAPYASQEDQKDGVIIEILIDENTRAISPMALINSELDNGNDVEQEILIDRGTTYQVVSKTPATPTQPRTIRVAVVSQDRSLLPVTEAPEANNSPEIVNSLGSEVSNPVEADAAIIDNTPGDDILIELLREGGSLVDGSRFNENWASHVEKVSSEGDPPEFVENPKTGAQMQGYRHRAKKLADFLTANQEKYFGIEFTADTYSKPDSEIALMPGLQLMNPDSNDFADVQLSMDAISAVFAQAVAAYTSGPIYRRSDSLEKRLQFLDREIEMPFDSPGRLIGTIPGQEKVVDFWRGYAAAMNDPSLLDADGFSSESPVGSLARTFLTTLQYAGALDGTYARTLIFNDVSIDDPNHPLHYLTATGQEVAIRPSSWGKLGVEGGTSDSEGLFTAEGFGEKGSLGDVVLVINEPEGINISSLTQYAENEALIKNGRYRVANVEKVTKTRKEPSTKEEYDHTYTQITLEPTSRLSARNAPEAESPVDVIEESDVDAIEIDPDWQTMTEELSPKEIAESLKKYYDKKKFSIAGRDKDLSDEEYEKAQELLSFTEDNYFFINERLRKLSSGDSSSGDKISEAIKKIPGAVDTFGEKIQTGIDAIHSLIEEAPRLPDDLILYRGLHSNYSEDLLSSLEIGDMFTDRGFSSTSLDPSVAEDFSTYGDFGDVVLEIVAPKGTRGIYISGYLDEDDSESTEKEVLLDSGTTYRVISRVENSDGELKKLRVAVVHQDRSGQEMPKANKPKKSERPREEITGAGRPPVDIENPRGIDESSFDGVLSLMEAINLSSNRESAGPRIRSAAVDSSDIEDLEIQTSLVADGATGRQSIRLRFKLTSWAGERQRKDILAEDYESEENLSEWSTENGIVVPYSEVDSNGVTVIDNGRDFLNYDQPYAKTFTRTANLSQGTATIKLLKGRYNEDVRSESVAAIPTAFHNLVTIDVPLGSTQEEIEQVLRAAGVQQVRAASEEDKTVLLENRLLSIFEGYNDPSINEKDQSTRNEKLLKIKSDWGVSPDDVEVSTDAFGFLTYLLPEETTSKIVQQTQTEVLVHRISTAHLLTSLSEQAQVKDPVELNSLLVSAIADIATSGLKSTVSRYTSGVITNGMSSVDDIGTGGADYVFTTPTTIDTVRPVYGLEASLVFSARKALRRSEFYANTQDQYGAREYDGPAVNALKEAVKSTYGSPELMVKHGLSSESAEALVLGDSLRTPVLEELRSRGISEINGIPIEDFVQLKYFEPNISESVSPEYSLPSIQAREMNDFLGKGFKFSSSYGSDPDEHVLAEFNEAVGSEIFQPRPELPFDEDNAQIVGFTKQLMLIIRDTENSNYYIYNPFSKDESAVKKMSDSEIATTAEEMSQTMEDISTSDIFIEDAPLFEDSIIPWNSSAFGVSPSYFLNEKEVDRLRSYLEEYGENGSANVARRILLGIASHSKYMKDTTSLQIRDVKKLMADYPKVVEQIKIMSELAQALV